jgi:hypothetical protein
MLTRPEHHESRARSRSRPIKNLLEGVRQFIPLSAGNSRGYVGSANNHIATTGGPKDGATCHGRHVLASVGALGHSRVPRSGTPMSKDGLWTTAADSGLGLGGLDYGGGAEAKKVQIGAVPLFGRASRRLVLLVARASFPGTQYLFRALSARSACVARCDPFARPASHPRRLGRSSNGRCG